MIPPNQALPPLAVISSVSSIDQNTSGGAGANNLGGQQLNKGGEQQFQSGQEMPAKVVATDGQGRYTLDAGGQRVEVRSETTLQVGQQFNVLVQKSDQGVLLALKSPDISQFLTRSLATGGSSQALGMIFGQGLAAQAGGGVVPVDSALLAGEKGGIQGPHLPASPVNTFSATKTTSPSPLPAPASAEKMVDLQSQFVDRSSSPRVEVGISSTQLGSAVRQFTAEISRDINPLLSQGRTQEAMNKLAAGLRSLAPFFPPQTGTAPLQRLNSQQQQLYQAFSLLQQPGDGEHVARGEAVLGRIVQQLQSKLTPALAMPGRDVAGPPQNSQAMLAGLGNDLLGMRNLIQLPAMFSNQPPGAAVFQRGLDGLFAFQLSLGTEAFGTGGSAAGTLVGQEAGSRPGDILRQLVDGLGLDMERLLAQGNVREAAKGLKFQLLQQVQQAQSIVRGEMQAVATEEDVEESGLLRQVGESHQTLQSLNFLQVLQANLDKQGALVLPLPLPFLEQGYLLLEERNRGEKEDGGMEEGANRFSVLMKLSSLGNVRVDFLQTQGEVYIRFHTESNEVSQLFQSFQQELRAGLHPLKVQGLSYAAEPAVDPLAILLQKCEGGEDSSLFRASV